MEDYEACNNKAKLEKYGFDSVEQLMRWRLYTATGGGLMAELGSHQLDACSIFLGKVHPLAVTGVGGKNFYQDKTDEVRGPRLLHLRVPRQELRARSPLGADGKTSYNDIVIVTYSSISTNGFEPYGECVMGTQRDADHREKGMLFYRTAAPADRPR